MAKFKGNRNKKYNSRGNKKRSGSKKEVEINVDQDQLNSEELSKPNDASWYNHYPELVRDAASLSFSDPLGTYVETANFRNVDGVINSNICTSVPGIMAIDYSPTIGLASGQTVDYINVSLNRLFVFLRRNLSTTSPYDASDLGYYLESMDSIYQLYQSAVRVYGLVQNSKVYNRYYPRAIVESMGFDFDWLSNNLSDFRGRLNYIAHTLAQFCVPSQLDFINRHIWMVSDIFYDAESIKSQTYYYRLKGYYKFVEATGSSTPAYLSYNTITYDMSNLMTGDEWLDMLNQCVEAIMNSTDMIAISGDLLKGFGADSMFAVQPIAEGYIIEATYSKEVLSQIENTYLLGEFTSDARITQNTDLAGGPNLIQNIQCYKTSDVRLASLIDSVAANNHLLNMHWDPVTPDDVMVATRLMTPYSIDNTTTSEGVVNGGVIVPWAFGTEIAHKACIYAYKLPNIPGSGSVTNITNYHMFSGYTASTTAYNATINYFHQLELWASFDWAPRMMMLIATSTTNAACDIYLDYDNYCLLADNVLNTLHRVAVTSEYDIPAIQTLSQKPVNK